MLDYDILRVIWFILLVVLFVGFIVTDGFDMGVGIVLLYLGKTDLERRVLINTISPHWEGNQVWLVTSIGAMFAAFPLLYGTIFNGLYVIFLLVFIALFLRPMAFDYRSKLTSKKWKCYWDRALFVGSIVPIFFIGLILGNVFHGLSFSFNEMMQVQYDDNLWQYIKLNGILFGFFAIGVVVMHGCCWLQLKTVDNLYEQSRYIVMRVAVVNAILFMVIGCYLYFCVEGFTIEQFSRAHYFDPLHKLIVQNTDKGAWFVNYLQNPLLFLVPCFALLCLFFVIFCSYQHWHAMAFLSSALFILCACATAAISLFPFLLPSVSHPSYSLLVWDSTSSQLNLQILLVVVFLFLPIVLAYTIWSYIKMSGRLDITFIEKNSKSLY